MAKSKSTSKKKEEKAKETTKPKPDKKTTTKPATESKETTKSEESATPPPETPPPEPIIEIDNPMMIEMVKAGLDGKRKLTKELKDKGINYDEEQFDAKLAELSFLQAIIKFKKGQYYRYVPRPMKPLCHYCDLKKCRVTRLRRKNFPRICRKLQFIE